MTSRITKIILCILLSVNAMAQVPDASFFTDTNIIFGEGVSKSEKKADKEAFEELAKALSTTVTSKIVTSSNGEIITSSSNVTTSTSVNIRNARKIKYKDGNRWYVYRYIISDDPNTTFSDLNPGKKMTQPTNPQPVQFSYYQKGRKL